MIDAPIAADDTALGTGVPTADSGRGKQNSHWTLPSESRQLLRLTFNHRPSVVAGGGSSVSKISLSLGGLRSAFLRTAFFAVR